MIYPYVTGTTTNKKNKKTSVTFAPRSAEVVVLTDIARRHRQRSRDARPAHLVGRAPRHHR